MALSKMKKRVAAGVMALTMVGGAGAAFASTDAGTQLQNWYNSKLNASTVAMIGNIGTYVNGILPGVNNEVKTLKQTSISTVSTAGTNEESRAIGAINTARDGYINKLDAKNTTIKNGMQAQYTAFVTSANTIVNQGAQDQLNATKTDFNTAITNQGNTSVGNVTTNVGAAKTAAEEALNAKITAVQGEITELITAKQEASEQLVKDNIDAQIQAKMALLTTYNTELVNTQKTRITTEGSRIQGLAETSLDNIVKAIK